MRWVSAGFDPTVSHKLLLCVVLLLLCPARWTERDSWFSDRLELSALWTVGTLFSCLHGSRRGIMHSLKGTGGAWMPWMHRSWICHDIQQGWPEVLASIELAPSDRQEPVRARHVAQRLDGKDPYAISLWYLWCLIVTGGLTRFRMT